LPSQTGIGGIAQAFVTQCNGRQFRALTLKAAHKQTGEILRQSCRATLATHQDFAATGHTGHQRLNTGVQGFGQCFGSLILQVGTVDEMLLNAQV
jgi:hypothetical protein